MVNFILVEQAEWILTNPIDLLIVKNQMPTAKDKIMQRERDGKTVEHE